MTVEAALSLWVGGHATLLIAAVALRSFQAFTGGQS